MKLIYCELCHELKPLTMVEQICSCGNIGGVYYSDGVRARILLKGFSTLNTSKVLGVNNSLLMGVEKRAMCHVGEWNDNQLDIYVDGIKQEYDEIVLPEYTSEDLNDAINAMLPVIGKTNKDILYKDRISRFFNRIKGHTDRIRFKDGSYILFSEQPDTKDFICVHVQKSDKYLIETKLIPYDL